VVIQTIHQWQNTFVEDGVFVCAKAVDDYTDELTPAELEAIATAVNIRRHTYSTGRFCAKTALSEIGLDRHDYSDGLLRQEDGSVGWPKAAVGSISHTNDWAIAAVAKSGKDYLSLGVDIEKIDRVDKNVLRHIATDDERARLESDVRMQWGRVALFSVKESIYKCLRPLYGEYFGFKDVQISRLNIPFTGNVLINSEASRNGYAGTDQLANGPELYSPAINLLAPSLAASCDEQRIHVRLAILPSHVLSLVSYHAIDS